MALVEMILQGKGGVGKTFAASLLAQHYKGLGVETVCIDADPVNATFSGYKAFGVERVELLSGKKINPKRFDELVGKVIAAPENSAVIVDNGASSFVALCSYLLEHDALSVLKSLGHRVRLHTVVTGGQGLTDTLGGFDALCRSFPEEPVILWKNEYFGALRGENGSRFEDFDVYKRHGDRVKGEIVLPEVERETVGEDMDAMLRRRMTFREAIDGNEFFIMSRQRLTMYWRDVDGRMKTAQLWGPRTAAARPGAWSCDLGLADGGRVRRRLPGRRPNF